MYYRNAEDDSKIIIIVGETGVGKSYLIRETSGIDIEVGHNLSSCTEKPQAVKCKLFGKPVILIDTPGFDDTYRSDTEILEEITDMLCDLYESASSKICGVIYIHKISETRMKRSAMKNITLFRKLCGDDNLSNVVLLTNRWDTVDYQTGLQREQELINNYWKLMIGLGCKVERYTNRQEDITRIFNYLLQKNDVVLDIQKEVVDQGIDYAHTSAANIIYQEQLRIRQQHYADIQAQKEMARQLKERNDELLRQKQEEKKKLQQQINNLQREVAVRNQRLHQQQQSESCLIL